VHQAPVEIVATGLDGVTAPICGEDYKLELATDQRALSGGHLDPRYVARGAASFASRRGDLRTRSERGKVSLVWRWKSALRYEVDGVAGVTHSLMYYRNFKGLRGKARKELDAQLN